MSHHFDESELKNIVKIVKDEGERAGKPIAILFDLAGPKIRVKQFTESSNILVKKGETYTLGADDCDIPLNISIQFDKVSINGKVKIDDGRISFDIIENRNNNLLLKAINTAEILPGKGINFPGVELGLPSITEKDAIDLQLAIDLEADWIAISFTSGTLRDSCEVMNFFKSET